MLKSKKTPNKLRNRGILCWFSCDVLWKLSSTTDLVRESDLGEIEPKPIQNAPRRLEVLFSVF